MSIKWCSTFSLSCPGNVPGNYGRDVEGEASKECDEVVFQELAVSQLMAKECL